VTRAYCKRETTGQGAAAGEAGAHRFDKAYFELRQHEFAAGCDDRANDQQHGEQAEQ
jgi:hypothetical protein